MNKFSFFVNYDNCLCKRIYVNKLHEYALVLHNYAFDTIYRKNTPKTVQNIEMQEILHNYILQDARQYPARVFVQVNDSDYDNVLPSGYQF